MVFGRRRKQDNDVIDDGDDLALDVEEEVEPDTGPFDSASAPDDDINRLDLGSLRIPALPGLKMVIPADDQGRPRQEVTVKTDDSVLRVAAFAAPRSAGIWDEIREELTDTISGQDGKIETEDGPYGVELVAYQPGEQSAAMTRFVGIDGPRWFLRVLFQGSRADTVKDDSVLDECLRGIVVERGQDAMPVREGLPLRLPAELVEEQQKRSEAETASAESAVAGGKVNGSGGSRSKRKPSPKPKST